MQRIPNPPQPLDMRPIAGSAAAIVVAMINSKPDATTEDVKAFIGEIVPAFAEAVHEAQVRVNNLSPEY